jgi:hypothetical protein
MFAHSSAGAGAGAESRAGSGAASHTGSSSQSGATAFGARGGKLFFSATGSGSSARRRGRGAHGGAVEEFGPTADEDNDSDEERYAAGVAESLRNAFSVTPSVAETVALVAKGFYVKRETRADGSCLYHTSAGGLNALLMQSSSASVPMQSMHSAASVKRDILNRVSEGLLSKDEREVEKVRAGLHNARLTTPSLTIRRVNIVMKRQEIVRYTVAESDYVGILRELRKDSTYGVDICVWAAEQLWTSAVAGVL